MTSHLPECVFPDTLGPRPADCWLCAALQAYAARMLAEARQEVAA